MRLKRSFLVVAGALVATLISGGWSNRGVPISSSRPQESLLSYGATCNNVADDTSAFLAFKAAHQNNNPIELLLPSFCTYNPVSGENQQPFKGIGDLIVSGTGPATSGIKNIAASNNWIFGGKGQFQDSNHSVRTADANAGDSCVTLKTLPAVTVSAVNNALPYTATFQASASGTTLTVNSVSSGTILPGSFIANQDSNVGGFAAIQPYGTGGTTGTGGAGTYALTVAMQSPAALQTFNTVPATFNASVDVTGVMTVNSISDGQIYAGMLVYSLDGAIGTAATVQPFGTNGTTGTGSTGTYQLNHPGSAAVPSQAFLGNGQVRVTLNSTSGLTSGDTLFLTGVVGRGTLPQRVNGLRWIKVVDGTRIDLFQSDFNGSYTSGGTGGGDRTSLTPAGSKVMMTGYVLQAYWAAPYGFPSNQHWFEYKTVQSTNSSTHQVCFTTPLVNSYKASWPQYNTGSQFEVDTAGPATLYVLDPTWELKHVYRNFAIDNPNYQTNAIGRDVTFDNVTFTGVNCAIPSQNETHTWNNINAPACNIELDKLVGRWNINSTTLHNVNVQSSSTDEININTVTVNAWYGTPKRFAATALTAITSSGNSIHFGTSSYGAADQASCTNCSFTNPISSNSPVHQVLTTSHPWTMSGGIITIPNAYSMGFFETQTRGLIPGHYAMWQGAGGGGTVAQTGRAFKIVSVSQDTENTYVTTSDSGGFPTGAWTTNGLSTFPHPSPLLTISGATGNAQAMSFNGCTALPMFSCSNFTQTGSSTGGSTPLTYPIMWGELQTMTFANVVPYAGAGALGWTMERFANQQYLKTDNTTGLWGTTNQINMKLPTSCSPTSVCTRTLTQSGATNTQSLDNLTTMPAGAVFGGLAQPIFTANTPSDSPQISVTIRTDQHLP